MAEMRYTTGMCVCLSAWNVWTSCLLKRYALHRESFQFNPGERERAGDTRGSIHVLRNWSDVCFSLKCVMVYDRCDFNITLDIPPFIQCFTTRGNNTVAIFRYWIAQRPLLGDWTWYSAPNCWQIARIWWHCTWYNELFELQRKSFIYCSKQSILYQCIVSVTR